MTIRFTRVKNKTVTNPLMNKCSTLKHITMFGWEQFPTVIYSSNNYRKEPRENKGKELRPT